MLSEDLCCSNLLWATQSWHGHALGTSAGPRSWETSLLFRLNRPPDFHIPPRRTPQRYILPFLRSFTQNWNFLHSSARERTGLLMHNNPASLLLDRDKQRLSVWMVPFWSKYRVAFWLHVGLRSSLVWVTFFSFIPSDLPVALSQNAQPTKKKVNVRNRLSLNIH